MAEDGCVLLSTTTLGGSASSITISGIDQSYHALRIVSLLGTDGTAAFDGDVEITYAGVGSAQYNNVAPAYYSACSGVVSKTSYTGMYSYVGEDTVTRSAQFGAGWAYTGRNTNNVASLDLYCADYANTGSPLVVLIKNSKGAVGSTTPYQLMTTGVSATVGNSALTGITFTAGAAGKSFTTASSVRIYGYIT